MDEFLAKVHTGHFSLQPLRPMKIEGGIGNIRVLYLGREGNIRKYSMLGSQNAITETPPVWDEKKLADDIAKKIEKSILPGQTKKEPTPAPTPAPSPTPAPAPSPEPAPGKELPKPSIPPPYLLPSQRPLMDQWNEYLKSRYGEKESLPYVDKVVDESEEFSSVAVVYKYLLDQLRTAQSTKNKTSEWVRNRAIELSQFALEGINALIKTKVSNKVGQAIIGKIKDEVSKQIGKSSTDIEGDIKRAMDSLFVGNEKWKSKIATSVEKQEGEPQARDELQKAGYKVIQEYKDYKLKKITLSDWKNSQAREDYDVLYQKYIDTYGKAPYFDRDPLKWNNS
jgi:hypothetical protein